MNLGPVSFLNCKQPANKKTPAIHIGGVSLTKLNNYIKQTEYWVVYFRITEVLEFQTQSIRIDCPNIGL